MVCISLISLLKFYVFLAKALEDKQSRGLLGKAKQRMLRFSWVPYHNSLISKRKKKNKKQYALP